jgi:hypothetical protein
MKTKLFCIIIIAFASISGIKAQAVKKGDFNIDINVSYLTKYSFNSDFATGGAPFGLGVSYAVSNKILIGAEFGFLNLTTSDKKIDPVILVGGASSGGDSTLKPGYSFHANIFEGFVLGDIQYHWINKDKFSLYSGLGLGAGGGTADYIYSDNASHTSISTVSFGGFEYQITFIGIRTFQWKHVGFHFELGYGIKGIAGGGINFKF